MSTKPRILVLYYTQTGQMQRVLESIVSGMEGKAEITGVAIEPETAFPFPWTTSSFFAVLPDTVLHKPMALKPLPEAVTAIDYDLVILGYQPWFCNPSLPVTSFLQSRHAHLLKGKPVITVIACRKMWLHAQEKIKDYLEQLNGKLVGNIILKDRSPGPVSVLTTARWSFKGKKEADNLLPAAGIAHSDIIAAKRFGMPVYKHLAEDNLIGLQQELLSLGAVRLTAAAIPAEKRRLNILNKGALYIAGKADTGRDKRIGRFKKVMLLVYFLWPGFLVITVLALIFKSAALIKDREYFRELDYTKGKI